MSYYSSIIKQLEASRRLGEELALQKHHQELQKSKIEIELQNLKRSRQEYINNQIAEEKRQYEKKLTEDNQISEEHKRRKQRASQDKAKIAQMDFERQRERLLQERVQYDGFDKEYRVLDKFLLDIQTRSKMAEKEENRQIFQLETRKATILKLLEESRQRQFYHFERAKQLPL